MGGFVRTALACTAVALGVRSAHATQVTLNFSGSIASGHAASASFTFNDVANTVKVRIQNDIDSSHNGLGSRALTGLFWDMVPTAMPFTSVSAAHGGYIGSPTGLSPTQVWAFRSDLSSASTPFGTQFGLGASGFGAFGGANMLAPGGPHPQPNGLDGGILSPTGNTYSGQNQNPQFRTFVEFTFNVNSSFFAGGINNVGVTGVSWQFGSGFNEPGITLIPLPTGVWAGGAMLTGLAGFGWVRRRSLKA